MSDVEGGLIEVYLAHAKDKENLEQAMHVLREGGLTPFMMDHIDPAMLYASRGLIPLRIGVPEEEAEKAARVIEKWNDASIITVEKQVGIFKRDIILSLPVAIAAFFASGFVEDISNVMRMVCGFLAWVVAFLAVSNIPSLHEDDGQLPTPAENHEVLEDGND
jgi:hypothetical protein